MTRQYKPNVSAVLISLIKEADTIPSKEQAWRARRSDVEVFAAMLFSGRLFVTAELGRTSTSPAGYTWRLRAKKSAIWIANYLKAAGDGLEMY